MLAYVRQSEKLRKGYAILEGRDLRAGGQMNKEATIVHIQAAFQGVPRPATTIGSRPFGIDLQLMEELEGRSWEAISTDSDFLCRHTDFAFFAPAAFHYFLPGYLIGAVNYATIARESFIQSLLFVLSPPDWAPEAIAYHDVVMKLLTTPQRRAVRIWLEYLVDSTPEDWWTEDDPPYHELRRELEKWKTVTGEAVP